MLGARLRSRTRARNGGRRPLAAQIRALFSNNEQGVWYDPSDLSTLFQDSAGTTPVTAAGQPVGLMLDKSRGLVRGAELATGVWSGGNGAAVSGDVTITYGGAVSPFAYSAIPTAVGKRYTVSVRVASATNSASSSSVRMSAGTMGAGDLFLEPLTATVGRTVSFSFVATGAASYLTLLHTNNVAGGAFTFDNISVRELPGAHATQSTATSRPILGLGNGKYYLTFDGVDDSLATPSIDFTATDKMTVVAGIRKLSDAATAIACELSADINANNGSFYLAAPRLVSGTNGAASKGTAVVTTDYSDPAPSTGVYSASMSISTDSLKLRRNGAQVTQSVSDQGTGNYGNYPLYIGRRGGTTLPLNGRLYGLIVRGAQSSDAQIAAAERYLNGKTGAF